MMKTQKTDRAIIFGDIVMRGLVDENELSPTLHALTTQLGSVTYIQVAYGPVWGGWESDVLRKIPGEVLFSDLERVVVETR